MDANYVSENWNKIQTELSEHKGELVLDDFDVVLLLDAIVGEDDYYWVIYRKPHGIMHLTCVAMWIP